MKDISEISGLMGSYLLKGWIMLGDACPSCDEVPLLEDPSNGIRYCMRCSPPVSSDRNTSIEKGTRSNNSPSNKDDKSFKNCSIGTGAGTAIEGIRKSESDKGFGAPIENNTYENVRKMISQLSIIGAATLENSGIPINERYVRSFKLNIK